MAFYSKSSNVPRDPSAIDERSTWDGGGNLLSLVILLLIIGVAFGLYALYTDSLPLPGADATPPAAQLSPAPAPAPAPAPPPAPTP